MFRCPWCESNELMQKYHDEEWGARPCTDTKHFEFITLEAAQAGLSWMTVLRRRESYREAFAGFDPAAVAGWGERELEILMQNPGIIRNRQKLTASIRNAQAFVKVQREFGSFDDYLLSFTGGQPVVNSWEKDGDIPAATETSQALSADMKKRGFQFLGPTVVYSHLQAAGIIDDHVNGCFRKAPAGRAGIDPNKARVLARIGRALEAAGILWAVGGSAMLYRHGIVDDFHDLDLVVGAQDAQKADAVLSALGTVQEKAPSDTFASDFYRSYEIEGVEVDAMAGMVIISDGRPCRYLFDEDSITGRWPVNGVHIPLAALEDWYILYLLMGRAEKAERIRGHLERHGVWHPALLARMLPGMPDTIRELVNSLL
jgi:DNA-3-methyladenine glycosylase I